MRRLVSQWAMMPSVWIEDGGLHEFHWRRGEGSSNLAALMTYIPLVHHADDETGAGAVTYDQLADATTLSRSMISRGLSILEERALITRGETGQSAFRLVDFNRSGGWAKFPEQSLYVGSTITAFEHFHLRRRVELDSLKLMLLFAARRDQATNRAYITYDQIEARTGISRSNIRSGISFLSAHGLIHVEQRPSATNSFGVVNTYRLVGIDNYRHAGTIGRSSL